MNRHLNPAEVAKLFGTSIKALRLYEQHGLLTPSRTSNGSTGSAWRAYGPDQIARLHQILALKRLGLRLARIAELLGSENAMEPVLALQEQSLVRDSERLAHALKVVRAARAKLASGLSLSVDDLATLTKETVTMSKLNLEELKAIFKPVADGHFTPQEQEAMRQRVQGHCEDIQSFSEDALAIRVECEVLMDSGADPTSAPVQALARRLRDKLEIITGGDPDLREKLRTVGNAVRANPAHLERLPPNELAYHDFMRRAREYLEATS